MLIFGQLCGRLSTVQMVFVGVGQLCGRLSTVQMVFVGVGWVVVGCRGGGGGRL